MLNKQLLVSSKLVYQLAFTELKALSTRIEYCIYREAQRLVQFLKALRANFEGLWYHSSS